MQAIITQLQVGESLRRFAMVLGSLLVLTAGVTQSAQGQSVKFNSPVTYPAGHPYVVTCGDLNRDGKMDLVAGDVTNNDLVVLLGNGDGTLKPPLTYHMAATPYEVTAADFNRDGKLDLLIGNSSAATSISILFGKDDGSFEPPASYAVPGRHFRVADFNRDGWLDLGAVTGTYPNTSALILLNKGNGTFQDPRTYSLPANAGLLGAKDVNGDGIVDLVAVGRSGNFGEIRTASMMAGNGDGTFRSPINSISAWGQGSGPYSITIEDFDRDGKLDVALTDEFLTVLKGNGDGTFKAPSTQPRMYSTSVDLKVADFNGDGKLDLVSSGVFSGGFQILLGNGDGTFQDAGVLANGMTSVSVVVTDLNGDTRPDLAGNTAGQLAVALLNVTPGNVDNTDYFVHQHYMDFLDREPDANGFGFWSNQITSCGVDPQCLELKRINVSGAFYLSIEFQQTAFLVERMYKTAYGDAFGTSTNGGAHQLSVPIVRLNELLLDTHQLGQEVIVLQSGWEQVLENNKQTYVNEFVQRLRFTTVFPTSLTPTQFVERLNQNAGNVLSSSERATAIELFKGASDTNNLVARAQALRQVVEDQDLYQAEFNRAFVLMQYFGYLRRNPDDAPEATRNYTGYDFWLTKLNNFNGNFINAEMVKAFITSGEYRNRFGP
jgi:VCBS repeat protein